MSENITNEPDASCCEVGAKRGKAGPLGALAAVFASACCGVPLLLIALGLGGLGFGSFLGKYHWYVAGAGAALLAAAWFVFLRERAKLHAAGSEIRRNARLTPALLAVATAAVIGFGGLNVVSALGLGTKAQEVAMAASNASGELAQVVLPVEGMTCITCEFSVERALGKLEGVLEAKASASEQKVLVRYRPGRVTFDQMVEAVDTTGYKAQLPDS